MLDEGQAYGRAVRLGLVVAVTAIGCSGQPPSPSAVGSQPFLATEGPNQASASAAVSKAEPPCSFGIPSNLGAVLNTEGFDGGPAVSRDGLRLYFVSERPGGQGGGDVWVAERASSNALFGSPTNLGPGVNGMANEGAPTLSRDELTLFFDRDDGGIWTATRPAAGAGFGQAARLPAPVSNPFASGFPALSADGLTLYFASGRPPGEGGDDLWRATRMDADGPFAAVENLGSPVNEASADAMPAISADDLRLVFGSRRKGGLGDWDLWMADRTGPDAEWGPPVNLGPDVNSHGFDGRPYLSSDGSVLFFMSDRPGGQGGIDLWQAAVDCTKP